MGGSGGAGLALIAGIFGRVWGRQNRRSMRHLTPSFAIGALRRGGQIDQFLGGSTLDGKPTVRWASVYQSGHDFVVAVHAVEDIGSADYAGVTESPPVDEDEYVGEGKIIGRFETPDEALRMSESLGARPNRWVNAGLVCEEYLDYVRSMRA